MFWDKDFWGRIRELWYMFGLPYGIAKVICGENVIERKYLLGKRRGSIPPEIEIEGEQTRFFLVPWKEYVKLRADAGRPILSEKTHGCFTEPVGEPAKA